MENINYGIDLGTTNSGIAVFTNGKVNLLKNPVGFLEILPSVVAFKKDRILVGDKAKEQLLTNPDGVFSSFKRKMGTNEVFDVPSLNSQTNPIDLSALVLKELQNFGLGAQIDSAVITIPASFDTIQSNATKEAGMRSGLSEVVLLQEPIAACLAYANENNLDLSEKKIWLVYDFGGGTFDAALVSINERELKVIDHKGNNFLGGVDLDLKILTDLVIPKLEDKTGLTNLWSQISQQVNSTYNKLGKYLIYKAESAKKDLSITDETWIELDFPELEISCEFKITRTEFDILVEPCYAESFQLVDELLKQSNMSRESVERIILVGGTTYIPFIRKRLNADTGIEVDTTIDPTTAVIKGAAFYAGTKSRQVTRAVETDQIQAAQSKKDIPVFELTYENMTKDAEELITVKSLSLFNGFMRISRTDGGFDTGKVPFNTQTGEFVSLLPKQVNTFTVSIFDTAHELVYTKSGITISQGMYNISGQPLPNDICIELDSDEETYLELIFKKNDILPLKKTIYKTFSKSVAKNGGEKIVINIVEGKIGTMPGSNLNIGYIELKGADLNDDLIKGTDVELSFAISESRDLTVSIFIPSANQEIKKTFNPQYQNEIGNEKMLAEIERGLSQLDELIRDKEYAEDFMALAKLVKVKKELIEVSNALTNSSSESFTDSKYQLADKKRKLLFEIDQVNLLDDLSNTISTYNDYKTYLHNQQDKFTPAIKHDYENVIRDERSFLQSGDKYLIKRKIEALKKLDRLIYYENDESYYSIFTQLQFLDASHYEDYPKTQRLFEEGEKALDKRDLKRLRATCMLIFGQLKEEKKNDRKFDGTGLR